MRPVAARHHRLAHGTRNCTPEGWLAQSQVEVVAAPVSVSCGAAIYPRAMHLPCTPGPTPPHARSTRTHEGPIDSQEGLPGLSLHVVHWRKFGPGAVGVGWELGLMGPSIHLSQPTEPRPDEAALSSSRAGDAFITGSSERWERAAVAFGTDPDVAGAAARRTTAFHSGEPDNPT